MVSILLKERNLLFVHVPKTGGGSISRALRNEADAVLYPVQKMAVAEPCLVQLSKQVGKPLGNYRTVAFIRNPWDWAVSGYLHVTKNMPAYIAPPTFKEFVKGRWQGATILQYPTKFTTPEAFVAYHTQITPWEHLFPTDHNLSVDELCMFESLERDARRVFELTEEMPHANRSDRLHYSEYYDDETQALIAERHADLIAKFEYSF